MVDRILNKKEVAEKLNVSISTVNRLIQRGKLKKVNVSIRKVGVRESDLQAFIESLNGGSE
jgi:excisionase family DNA binding protein